MELYTSRLLLRPWTVDDAPALFTYASDPRIGPIAGWPPHTSVENSADIIRDVLSTDETYAIVLVGADDPIASIGLNPPADVLAEHLGDNDTEIGYWVGVPHWGQGLIPEAVTELVRHAFEDLEHTAIWCGYYDGNEQSRRVQEKCGFHPHTVAEAPCPLLGETRTEHFSRLTRDEWEQTSAQRHAAILTSEAASIAGDAGRGGGHHA